MYVKRLAQCPAHSRRSINLSFPLSNLGIFCFHQPIPSCVPPPGVFCPFPIGGGGLLPLMETPSPPLSPSPDSPFLAPHPTPAGSSHCPGALPHPPFRARAESAWVNLAADSAGAGASPRLSRGVRPGPWPRLCPHPHRVPPTPAPAQRSDPQPRSQTTYDFGLQLSRRHSPPAPGETGQDREGAGRPRRPLDWTLSRAACLGSLERVGSLWASELEERAWLRVTQEGPSQNLPGAHTVRFQVSSRWRR